MVIKAFKKGSQGISLLLADVGSKDKMKDLGVHSMRIPSWYARCCADVKRGCW